jgi:2-octaprenyl-6-methoxyphenol hydroxylase
MLIHDVIIVGGGYSGLSLSLMLAQAQISSVVIEQAPLTARQQQQSTKPCRLFALAKATCALYEQHGITLPLAQIGQPINYIRVLDHGSTAILDFCPQDLDLDDFGYMVEEKALHAALLTQIKNNPHILLLEQQGFKEFHYQHDSVIVDYTEGSVQGQLLVAADGKNSRVRRQAGIETHRHNYKQVGIICDVEHENPHRGVAVERFLPNGPFAILPKQGGYSSSIVWTDDNTIADAIRSLTLEELQQVITQRFGSHLGKLKISSSVEVFPLELRHARMYHGQKLALIGDAAHAIHPVAGQGFNLGLRDADVLARLIAAQLHLGLPLGSTVMLAQYQRQRRMDNYILIEATHALNSIFASAFLPVRVLRRLGMRALNHLPVLKKPIMRYASGF